MHIVRVTHSVAKRGTQTEKFPLHIKLYRVVCDECGEIAACSTKTRSDRAALDHERDNGIPCDCDSH